MDLCVLSPNDRVEASGVIIRTTTGYALLRLDEADNEAVQVGAIHWPSSASVPIRLAGGREKNHLGQRGSVTGLWVGQAIADGVFSTHIVVREHDGWSSEHRAVETSARPRLVPEAIDRAEPARRRLLDEGVLVSHTRDDCEVHVVAHDADRAEELLRPFYGDALTVRTSPTSPSVYGLINNLIATADHQGVLFAAGGGIGFDFENTLAVEITYATPELKDLAADIPDGALIIVAQATAPAQSS